MKGGGYCWQEKDCCGREIISKARQKMVFLLLRGVYKARRNQVGRYGVRWCDCQVDVSLLGQ